MKVYEDFLQLIGNTPLVRLTKIEEQFKCTAKIFAKAELFNPTGSIKDRAAVSMVMAAQKSGKLKSGGTIIEPTSGNTGIGLAAIAARLGYKLILTMPSSMSEERKSLLRAYGAQLVLTDSTKGMAGAVEKAKEILGETKGAFMPSQFDNENNPEAHYNTTGPEIWADTDGSVDIFVAGIGTGGTFTGTSRYLKQQNPNVLAVAVEPLSSPLLSKGVTGGHKIQGIGANFVPGNLDMSLCDEVIDVADEDAAMTSKLIAHREGMLTGISSGAAVFAAVALAQRPENEGKNIVVIMPDTGDRYLSTGMFDK